MNTSGGNVSDVQAGPMGGRWWTDLLALVALIALLASLLVGCDATSNRYLKASVAIPELGGQQVSVGWHAAATIAGGSPVVLGQVDGAVIPADKVEGLMKSADAGKTDWMSQLIGENPELQSIVTWKREVVITVGEGGAATMCFVRTRAASAWEKEIESGNSMASADGLEIRGPRSTFVCVVGQGLKIGQLWRAPAGGATKWKVVGVVTRTAGGEGGDEWSIAGGE